MALKRLNKAWSLSHNFIAFKDGELKRTFLINSLQLWLFTILREPY